MFRTNKNKQPKLKDGLHSNPSKQKSETHTLAKENKKTLKQNQRNTPK